MDALSAAIEVLKLKTVVYQKMNNCSPWGIEMLQDNNSQFWRLLKGKCIIGLPDSKQIVLKEGDIVFIPHGLAHWIADDPRSIRMPAAKYTAAKMNDVPIFQSNGEESLLIGGHIQFASIVQHPFLNSLPQFIHISNFEGTNHLRLQHLSALILEELTDRKPGHDLVLKNLAEIFFATIIRAYAEEQGMKAGFLSATQDPAIGEALRLIQDQYEKDWSVITLSEMVALSRSVFFRRFRDLVKQTPLDYLISWRMLKAKELLLDRNMTMLDIAVAIGYKSEAAFNRVFKQKTGQTPAVYRRGKFDQISI